MLHDFNAISRCNAAIEPHHPNLASFQVLNIKEDDEVEVQKMLDAMSSAASVMDNNPISMTFSGTRSFGKGSVVYAAMTEGVEALRALYASLQVCIVVSNMKLHI